MNLQRVEALFHEALDLPPDQRARFLAENADQAERDEVESLLQAHFAAASPVSPLIGKRLGPYRIIGEIGRGGMGAIYEAVRDDDEFQKRVAIKIIKRGMDTDAIVRRFRSERQILADLDHPNIARLLDGGTTDDGLPFFVMEYIDGQPLDRYAAVEHVPLAARLRLVMEVCEAVAYANSRGVIHRDLKPSNILVSREGKAKLLDFGIAKVFETGREAVTATAVGQRLLTPAYASPEQISGDRVDVRSDVYALGVILHELVGGTRPAGSQVTLPGAERDLEAIISTALKPDPAERYASARDLSADLQRFLNGERVHARRPSRWSRTRRRTRVILGLAVAMLIITAVAAAAIVWRGGQTASATARPAIVARSRTGEAFRAYLSARHHWNKRTPESLQLALREFERAIDLDPAYARAYVGLSETYALLGEYRVLPPGEAMPRSRAAAQRALEIDDTAAEAHAALAYALAFYDWQWPRAGEEFRRALELEPDSATTHQWYGEYLTALGRFGEARQELLRAEELDPLSRMVAVDRAGLEYIARNFDEAIALSQKMIARDPNFGFAYVFLWISYELKGMEKEAIEALLKCEALLGMPQQILDAERKTYLQRGRRAFWMLRMEYVTKGPLEDVANNFDRALHAARLHQREDTMRWLLESEKSRDRWLVNAAFDPQFDLVRSDPRFSAMLARMGLPEGERLAQPAPSASARR